MITSHTGMLQVNSQVHFFLTIRLLAMSVSMSPGIAGAHLPLSSIGIMIYKRAESNITLRAHLGMQSIKCL